MIRRCYPALAIALLVLTAAGCGGQPASSPEQVATNIDAAVSATLTALPNPTARLVEVTQEVTVEITRVVTSVVTATPAPTPTARPTPRPTAKPTVVVPNGWETYQFIEEGGSICYPADWTVTSERKTGVTISEQDLVYVVAYEMPAVLASKSDSEKIKYLKSGILDIFNDLDSVRFAEELVAEDHPDRLAIVVAEVTDYVYDDLTSTVVSTYAEDGRKMVSLTLFVIGGEAAAGDDSILAAVRVMGQMGKCYRAED